MAETTETLAERALDAAYKVLNAEMPHPDPMDARTEATRKVLYNVLLYYIAVWEMQISHLDK